MQMMPNLWMLNLIMTFLWMMLNMMNSNLSNYSSKNKMLYKFKSMNW